MIIKLIMAFLYGYFSQRLGFGVYKKKEGFSPFGILLTMLVCMAIVSWEI